MSINSQILLYKYAKAFLNIHYKKIDENSVWNIKSAADFFNQNAGILLLFSIPKFSKSAKAEVLNKMLEKFKLPQIFGDLFKLLLEHNRPLLFGKVLAEIFQLYPSYIDVDLYNFKSVIKLSDEEATGCKNFLESKINKKVIFQNIIDENLIAGIRLQSKNKMWDCSIKSKIDRL